MRISDWSSDVCSSDLARSLRRGGGCARRSRSRDSAGADVGYLRRSLLASRPGGVAARQTRRRSGRQAPARKASMVDRKDVGAGKGGKGGEDQGGRRFLKKKKNSHYL